MDASLLSLPWQIQFSLAAGYAAYALAYVGIRSHHATIDIAFRTLVFSAIATFMVQLLLPQAGAVAAALIALATALIAGLLWRGLGRSLLRWLLEKLEFSFADDDPSAFSRIYGDAKHEVTQVVVTLSDDRELHCKDTSAFHQAAIAPFVLGTDGSVAMYATHECRRGPDGKWEETELMAVRDAAWGDQMTLIPASQVRHIELRFRRLNVSQAASAKGAL